MNEPRLAGRERELNQAVEVLSELTPSGVVFLGEPGVGTSRLAIEACVAMAGKGRKTVEVAGSLDADATPYGAVAHLLDEAAIRDGVHRDPIAMFAYMRELLGRDASPRRRPILYIDNVESVDDASRALIVRLTQADVVGIVTAAHVSVAPETTRSIDSELRLITIHLDPLDQAEVHQIAEDVLGATVDGLAANAIHRASGGLPAAVVELVTEAQRTGAMVFERGLWHLDGALAPSVTLRRTVAQRLDGLSDDALRLLSMLSVTDSMPVAAIEGNIDDGVIVELEERALLGTEGEGQELSVRVASPVVETVLRTGASSLRRRQLLRDAASYADGLGPLLPRHAMQVAVWRVEAGLETDVDLLVDGARQARANNDFNAVAVLAQAAHRARPSVDMALLWAEALYEVGYFNDATALMQQADALIESEVDWLRCANMHHRILFWGRCLAEESRAVLVAAREHLSNRLLVDLAKSAEANVLVFDGHPQDCLDLVATTDRSNPLINTSVGFPEAAATVYLGRAEDGLALAAAAIENHRALPPDAAIGHPLLNELVRCVAAIEMGHLAEAFDDCVADYERALEDPMPQLHGWFALSAARAALMRGQIRTAHRWFTIGRQASERIGFAPGRRIALNGLAVAAAQLGLAAEAAGYYDELKQGWRDIGFLAPESYLGAAWASFVNERQEQAFELLLTGAAEAAGTGEIMFQAELLYELARIGGADRAVEQMAALRGRIQGPLAAARHDAVEGLAADDVAKLQAAEQGFARCGAMLAAAETASAAGLLLRRDAQARAASAAFRRANEHLELCEGAKTPGLVLDADVALLSQREREIVNLALGGASSKEIARKLELSIRTVSNHLQNAYVKLGVSGRQELAEVLDADGG